MRDHLRRTNSDRLDSNSFLEVSIGPIIGVFRLEDSSSAKSVDESGSALLVSLKSSKNKLWEEIPVPLAPQTIKQN